MEYQMSELMKKYDTELYLFFKSKDTIESYKSALNKFLKETSRCYRMSEQDLKDYFSSFKNRYSGSYYNVVCSSVKILYERVLKQPRKMEWFVPIKTERKFVNILTFDDFKYIMGNIKSLKQKTITIILYSTGIRVNELTEIRLEDIDLINQRINIRTEKNGKNRFVQIHDITLLYLKKYLKNYNPKEFLFNGQGSLQYSDSSIRQFLNRASVGLNKKVYPHIFRHSYLSNMADNVNIFEVKELAGHRELKSTMHYYHIPQNRLRSMYNPLDKAI